ncbi:MAG: phosphatase PAP2 family protein [Muribaculaceae bacterium]|nr:phosphatase PAP2 family protein [Muribaculaceae bacterium]
MDYLLQLDTETFLTINGAHVEWLDQVMKMFSGRMIWILLYVMIAAMLCRTFGWQRALIAVLGAGIAVGLSDYTCASVIRPLVERLRPSNPDNPISEMVHIVNGYRSGAYGFPSCHAANTMALAMFTTLVFKRWGYGVVIFAWALMQCYSRIYLGVHYPGDLVAGAFVGILWAVLVYMPMNRYVDFRDFNLRAVTPPVAWTIVAICMLIVAAAMGIPYLDQITNLK